jgi:hypothetical protein
MKRLFGNKPLLPESKASTVGFFAESILPAVERKNSNLKHLPLIRSCKDSAGTYDTVRVTADWGTKNPIPPPPPSPTQSAARRARR